MKIKTMGSLLICLAMLLALFSGCGKNDTSSDVTTSQAAQTTAAAPNGTEEPEVVEASYFPLAETKEISYMYILDPNLSTVADTPNDMYVFKRIEEATNVHVDFWYYVGPAILEAYPIMIATGDYPDLIPEVNALYTGGISAALDNELIIDLAEYKEYMPNYLEVINSSDAYRLDSYDDYGRIGLFNTYYAEGYEPVTGSLVRTDWLEAIGAESPVTYDDWYNILTAWQVELGVDGALWVNCYGTYNAGPFAAGYDVYVCCYNNYAPFYQDDNANVHFSPYEQGWKDYYGMLAKWYSEGLVYSDFSSGQVRSPDNSLIADGKVGIWFDYASNMDALEALADGIKVGGLSDPVLVEGQVNHMNGNDSLVPAEGVSVSVNCKDIELAMRWLNWFYSEEGHIITNYGVEGETFTYINGEPVIGDLVLKNDEMTAYQGMRYYVWYKGPFVMDWKRTYYAYTDAQLDAIAKWDLADHTHSMPTSLSMTAEEASQWSGIFNEVSTYIQEYTLLVIVGEKNLESDYEDFLAIIKAMGSDTLLEIKQASLGRYYMR